MGTEIGAFLASQDVLIDGEASCKRAALSAVVRHAEDRFGVDRTTLLNALIEREHLGTTAIGQGVAIPHAKLKIDRLHGVFLRLHKPIDFDAVDDLPVDLIFLLLAPEEATAEHLKALSRIARLVRSKETQKALRGADNADAAYAIMIGDDEAEAA